jgi:hypothetical protein
MTDSSSTQPISKRKSRITAVLIALAVLFGGLFIASPANASTCTKTPVGLICGVVTNASNSTKSVQVGADWNGKKVTGKIVTLKPGQKSTAIKDVDAILVPKGYCATQAHGPWFGGGSWKKLSGGTYNFKVVKNSWWASC